MISKLSLAALAGVSLTLVSGPAFAESAVHAGSWTGTVIKQEAIPLGGPDHVLVAQTLTGTNKSIGSTPVGDGGKVLVSEAVELDKGNGVQHGQFVMADDKGSTTAYYEGKVTTTMVDGKPNTTGKGTWRWVSATGAYKGAKGGGAYSWSMTSPTDVAGEWHEEASAAQK